MVTQDTRQTAKTQRGQVAHAERDARVEQLVKEGSPLVSATVRRTCYSLSESDREEVESAGYLALVQAAQCFDAARGKSFRSHAIARIRYATNEAAIHARAGVWAKKCMDKWSVLSMLPACLPLEAPAPGKDGSGAESTQTLADVLPASLLDHGHANCGAMSQYTRSPEHRVTEKDARRELWRVVEEALPGKLGAVITLHYADGLTLKEISQQYGVSHQAVSQWHERALKTLRGNLTGRTDSLPN